MTTYKFKITTVGPECTVDGKSHNCLAVINALLTSKEFDKVEAKVGDINQYELEKVYTVRI